MHAYIYITHTHTYIHKQGRAEEGEGEAAVERGGALDAGGLGKDSPRGGPNKHVNIMTKVCT